MSERNDEIGKLIAYLKQLGLADMGDEQELTTIEIDRYRLAEVIKALERFPLPKGNPRRIGLYAAILEWKAAKIARKRKQELIAESKVEGKKKKKAIDAEWEAAEEARSLFLEITGRKLSDETIRRIMQQRLPRWPRGARPKKHAIKFTGSPFADGDIVVLKGLPRPRKSRR